MTRLYADRHMCEIQHVPEFSIIRIPDGRLAVVGVSSFKNRRKWYLACLDKGHAIELAADTPVDVVQYPSELAYAWLAQKQAPTTV